MRARRDVTAPAGSSVSCRIVAWLALCLLASPAVAIVLPNGFQEEVVFSGLSSPVNLEFAPDGRIFVAEKSGIIKVFDSLTDPTPDVFADLSTQVHDFWDRGLLGMTIDKDFPTSPYVYVLYTFNYDPNDPGAGMPRWPDSCPSPPGSTADGCVVNGRISKLEIGAGNTLVGSEVVLVENRWCQQYPSHSIGDLAFSDHERALYASAGDGASFNWVDYGQGGTPGGITPPNPCGDPDVPRGTAPSPPTAEGGALRSQDIRTSGDDVSLGGTIIGIDPDTGAALATNPLLGGDPGDDPVIAFGLRNPFRMERRDGTHELWVGDVGWGTWEEIDVVGDTEDSVVENFGWPCYEGAPTQGGYDGTNLDICENLYTDTTSPATAPYYAYRHSDNIDPDPSPFRCSKTGSSSIAGLAFYTGTVYPSAYTDALFFADYSRDCLFVMFADGSGNPDPSTRSAFADEAQNPVDLEVGPDGLLYWLDLNGGRVMRVNYFSNNTPPVAVISADATDGVLPLTVQFDGSGSSDPDPGDMLTYEWDLDGDGQFDDSTAVAPSFMYAVQGLYLVQLRVTDNESEIDVAQVLITAGNTSPTVTITSPGGSFTWKVGDTISFTGQGTDPEDGALPGSAFHWDVILHHCPLGTAECHAHPIESLDGVDNGSTTGPDHEWESFLELVLTADDAGFPGGGGGVLTGEDRLILDPESVDLTFETSPGGLELLIVSITDPAPVVATAIVGSSVPVSALSPQNVGGDQYGFVSWSDAGAAAHTITAPQSPTTYTATYEWIGAASDWWNPSWRARRRVIFDNSGQTADLDDFPFLVRLDPTRIDYAATEPGGSDVRFVDADGVTELAYEIETWNPAGESLFWVKVPRIDGGSTTDYIWMYHDNDAATTSTENPSAVWTNGYEGVWHLDDLLDSTSNGNDGTNNGSTVVAGQIGNARYFDGSSWVDAGNDASLAVTGGLTLAAWAKIDNPEQSAALRIVSKKDVWNGSTGYNVEYKPDVNHLTNLSSGSDYGRAEDVDLDTSWHSIVTWVQGGIARLFVDGVDVTTDTSCDTLAAGSVAFNIGRRSGGGDYFLGAIDEVRVASVVRSDDWVLAQHLSMSDGLATYGVMEDNCAPSDVTCDLFDDDCDGTADEDVIVPTGSAAVTVGTAQLSWVAVPDATTYRVVRGDVAALRSSGGDFATASSECVAPAEPGTSVPYAGDPASGAGFWFLVRPDNCAGDGTFDSGGAGQSGSRDAEIDTSAVCP